MIQKCCNHWCKILNYKKTMALVVSRSRTVNPPHGDLVLCGVSIRASRNLDTLGVKFDNKITFEDHVCDIVWRVSRVSQRIGILRWVKCIIMDTSELLHCYFAFVLPIVKYCSPVWGSAAECHLQLLECQVFSVARLCPDQNILSLCRVINVMLLGWVWYTRLIGTLITVCSASFNLLYYKVRYTRAATIAHPLKIEVSRCRTPQFSRCFLPAQVRMWDLPYTVFDTETPDGFKDADNRWLLHCVVFSAVLRGACASGFAKATYKQLRFSHLGLAVNLNNNSVMLEIVKGTLLVSLLHIKQKSLIFFVLYHYLLHFEIKFKLRQCKSALKHPLHQCKVLKFSVQCKVIGLHAFYDAITGPT